MPPIPPVSRLSRALRTLSSFINSINIFRFFRNPIPVPQNHYDPDSPAEHAKNLQGQVICGYSLTHLIDIGTFGAVYHTVHLATSKSYATKVYSLDWARSDEGEDVVQNEIQVMRRLRHRNITQLHDVLYTRHGYLLVMDLVQGKTLLDILPSKGGLMEVFARQIFVQLLDGIDYLHQNRIVHRDIKLENVMIDAEGTVKIIDYGLAERVPRSTSDELLVDNAFGSRNYFAPELVLKTQYGLPFQGDLADVWACCVVLFTMVAGFFPFQNRKGSGDLNRVEIVRSQIWMRNWLPSDDSLSPELKDLFEKMFIQKPHHRLSFENLRTHPWIMGTKLMNKKVDPSGGSPVIKRSLSLNLKHLGNRSSGDTNRRLGSGDFALQRCTSLPQVCSYVSGEVEARQETTDSSWSTRAVKQSSKKQRKVLGNSQRASKRLGVKLVRKLAFIPSSKGDCEGLHYIRRSATVLVHRRAGIPHRNQKQRDVQARVNQLKTRYPRPQVRVALNGGEGEQHA